MFLEFFKQYSIRLYMSYFIILEVIFNYRLSDYINREYNYFNGFLIKCLSPGYLEMHFQLNWSFLEVWLKAVGKKKKTILCLVLVNIRQRKVQERTVECNLVTGEKHKQTSY